MGQPRAHLAETTDRKHRSSKSLRASLSLCRRKFLIALGQTLCMALLPDFRVDKKAKPERLQHPEDKSLGPVEETEPEEVAVDKQSKSPHEEACGRIFDADSVCAQRDSREDLESDGPWPHGGITRPLRRRTSDCAARSTQTRTCGCRRSSRLVIYRWYHS